MTDSRDERTARPGDYLVRKGGDVFGWYSQEFRVRRRRCLDCKHVAQTIEVYLEDLDKSFDDVRDRATVRPQDIRAEGIRSISTNQLLTILDRYKNSSEDALSHLLSELLFRRSSPGKFH